jgi:hypothetical protein
MVAQLVNLISKGYRYYFVGTVVDFEARAGRDLRMLAYYEAGLRKWTRERRRLQGLANFRYLRHEDWFIVLATEGRAARFWSEDAHRIRDVRNSPIRFKGYSISYRQGGWKDRRLWADPNVRERDMKWHVRVQLDSETYDGLKAYFLNIATHRQADFLAREFAELTFQPYRPVREQLFQVLRAVNRARHLAGYQRIPASVIRFKRRTVKPFGEKCVAQAGSSFASLTAGGRRGNKFIEPALDVGQIG